MASQSLSENQVLPLRKFSFVTTLNLSLQSKFPWTHISQENLQASFDYLTVQNSQGLLTKNRVLKISLGERLVEQIFLDDLVRQARLDEARLQSTVAPDTSRIILVVVKRPFLAIRYQLPDGQIRRIQLNFLPENGYDVAVSIIAGHGLPVRDKNDTTQQHGLSRPPNFGQPTNNNITISQLSQYPNPTQTNSQPYSVGFHRPTISSQIGNIPSMLSFERDKHESNYGSQQISSANFNSGPVTSGHNVQTTSSTYQDEETLPGEIRPVIPTALPPADVDSFQAYSSSVYHKPSNEPLFGGFLPNHEPASQLHSQGPETQDPLRRTLFQATLESSRPLSAPVAYDSSKDILPPRRDLPFGRKAKEPEEENNQHKSSKKNLVEESLLKSKNNARALKDEDKATEPTKSRKKPAKASGRVDPCARTRAASPTKSKQSKPVRPATAPPKAPENPKPEPIAAPKRVTRKPAKRKTPATYKPSAMQTPMAESNTDSLSKTEGHAPTTTVADSMSVSEEWQTAVEAFVAKYANNSRDPAKEERTPPSAQPVSDLKEYASRPAGERRDAIDGMIMELIVDPDFETLCQDVESAWKRIGLGM